MLVGIVLAGGQSSRMGSDKALLEYHGESQLLHSINTLQEAGCEEVFISRNEPGFVNDIFPLCGPLGGIHACLKTIELELQPKEKIRCLIMPVDMPLLKTEHLKNLTSQDQHCFYQDAMLPCLLNSSSALVTQVEQRLQDNKLSLKGLLIALNAKELEENPACLINTNTPEEWSQLINEEKSWATM